MEIAVIGSGISGMSASLFLSRNNNVTLYEKNDYLGGHSNTKKINYNSKKIDVDTGFIVFNELNYPNLLKLFNHYNVVYEESDMSLSVSNLHNGLEWSGQNLGTIFLDKRRFFNYKFIRFVFDILKFNLQVKRNIQLFSKNNETLEDWLKNKNFSQQFKEDYLLPMSAAIWSMSEKNILNYPISNLLSFFNNHRLLHRKKMRPKWLTVSNGSKSYIEKIFKTANFEKRLNSEVQRIYRKKNKIIIIDASGYKCEYDKIIFSIHPERILKIENDFDEKITNILKLFKTTKNIAYLHYDKRLMPKNKKLWSSWNVFSNKNLNKVSLTYWMNKLQNIDFEYPLFVSLNPIQLPDENKIFERINYEHPLYDTNAIIGQQNLESIQGYRDIWYSGAWTDNGFHEAGISSSVKIISKLNGVLPWN